MDRKIRIAIILNILNLLDLMVTWIGSQTAHIDFITTEENPLFIYTYSELLAGNPNPFFLFLLIKILAIFFFTLFLIRVERNFLLSIFFGIIFSLYLVSTMAWILLIFGGEPPSPLAVDFSLVGMFILSFFIYYSPSELKNNVARLSKPKLKEGGD